MQVVCFLLIFVSLSTQESNQPEKWRLKLQALLYNYRHSSASEPRNQTRQAATINCDNSGNAKKQCLLEPDKYFANLVFTLSFRIGTLDSFEKRYKRLEKFVKVIRGKASKNATFESVTSMLLDSLGGDPTNFTCLGEEERLNTQANISKVISVPELSEVSRLYQQTRNKSKIFDAISQGSQIYEVLSNCSSSVSYWCTVDNTTLVNMNSTWKNCEKLRKDIVQKSDRCRLSQEDAKCFCYEGLELMVQEFKREKCADIKEDERKTVDKKGECLDAFRACRQMENEAFFTINQCDHKPVEVLIKSSRSLKDFLEDEEDNDDYDIDYEEDYHDDSWYVDYEHYHVDLTRF